jgi:hypothetical protein
MEYIPRLVEQKLDNLLENKEILILLGARQVGKTTMLEHVLKSDDTTLLNCIRTTDKTRLLAASKLSTEEAMRMLGNPKILIIDEAQTFPDIGRIAQGWYDSHISTKIILLGSSSLDLLDRTAEPLTGRNQKQFLTPLLFTETLQTQDWYSPDLTNDFLSSNFPEQLEALLMERMVYGSYPKVVLTSNKEDYLANLTSDYLLRDVLHAGLVKYPSKARLLLELLAHQTGSEVSLNSLSNESGISRETIDKYLDLLERSYVVFRLHAYSTNQRKEITKGVKVFFWDTGVRNALLENFSSSPLRTDIGELYENWVIAEVAKRNLIEGSHKKLYFWRKTEGSEVDLVIRGTDLFEAYELKWSKKGSTKGSRSFMNTYNIPVETINRSRVLDLI